MDIYEIQENSFIVQIERKQKESRLEYLTKCLGCVKKFYLQNAERVFKDFSVPFGDLEALVGELNFMSGFDFDVKWSVYVDGDPRIPSGIFVRSHYDREKIKCVQRLKKMWAEFSYEC